MNIVFFCHSLISDWNHGNAHFLRGVVWELIRRGHRVTVYEPARGWSLSHLLREHGPAAVDGFLRAYPGLDSVRYEPEALDLDQALHDADVVVVHEWNDHGLVRSIGAHRKCRGGYKLFFHDTHHRSVTDPEAMSAYDLSGYDGVLAYGATIAAVYRARSWARRVWIWHEAADTRVFRPCPGSREAGDLVWIGNWGDGERERELREFLIEPVKSLRLRARVYGVRYPAAALDALAEAGIDYGGWLPNYCVPETFARYRVTIHVHRRPYASVLHGIPTIRPFEALACGIPLICSPWNDSEGLFTAGADYLIARDGSEMKRHLRALLDDPEWARALASRGARAVLDRHTCGHRVDQLLDIVDRLDGASTPRADPADWSSQG